VVDLRLACTMHALTERDLAGVSSVVVGPPGRNGKKPTGPRLFLRSDVEACAARVHGDARGGGEAAAHKRAAAAAWKANSFKADPRGNGAPRLVSPSFHLPFPRAACLGKLSFFT
jgi:hypothetical protein